MKEKEDDYDNMEEEKKEREVERVECKDRGGTFRNILRPRVRKTYQQL